MFADVRRVAAASAVLSYFLVASAMPAAAAIMSKAECAKAVDETKAAYAEYEGLGPKAKKAFAEIVALAETRCAEGEFDKADDLLQIARGMVATD